MTIDPELVVDRVALAIHEAFEEDFPKFTAQKWDALTPIAKASMRKRAIAAICAYEGELTAILCRVARLLPRYRMRGETTGDDEALDAVLESVLEAINAPEA